MTFAGLPESCVPELGSGDQGLGSHSSRALDSSSGALPPADLLAWLPGRQSASSASL